MAKIIWTENDSPFVLPTWYGKDEQGNLLWIIAATGKKSEVYIMDFMIDHAVLPILEEAESFFFKKDGNLYFRSFTDVQVCKDLAEKIEEKREKFPIKKVIINPDKTDE